MREQLFRLRFQLAAGQMESVKRLRELRKDMARLMTARREQELKAKHG
jgi:large subunit ribosomal protein L29